MTLRALSLYEPWATLMAIGAKRIETRHWPTNCRGPVVIHAAKNRSEIDLVYEPEFAAALNGTPLTFGALLCVVDLIDCQRANYLASCPFLRKDRGGWTEFDMGNYDESECPRYGFVTKNLRRLPEPLPYRGAQGFFNVEIPDELAASLGLTPERAQEVLL